MTMTHRRDTWPGVRNCCPRKWPWEATTRRLRRRPSWRRGRSELSTPSAMSVCPRVPSRRPRQTWTERTTHRSCQSASAQRIAAGFGLREGHAEPPRWAGHRPPLEPLTCEGRTARPWTWHHQGTRGWCRRERRAGRFRRSRGAAPCALTRARPARTRSLG